MASVATAEARCVRLTGMLDQAAMSLLVSAISDGDVVLDLSEVTDADEGAVNQLARLPAGECGFVGCPRWLAQRVERRLIEIAGGVH